MSQLPNRLRTLVSLLPEQRSVFLEAADEIDRLVSQVEDARAQAIEECAKIASLNYAMAYTATRNKEVAISVSTSIVNGIRALSHPLTERQDG